MSANSSHSAQSQAAIKNHILAALPPEDFERLSPDLEAIKMPQGKILYRPDEPINHVYFPDTAMVSVVTLTAEGQCVEAGIIGREGMAGLNVLLGVDSMPNENIVQLAGNGWRLSTRAFRREVERGGALQKLALRFVHAVLVQIGQSTLCNRLHSTEERLSRWLLMSRDRATSDEIKLTQEFLAIMLGANRATVTMSAIALQSAGYIKHTRGLITIKDRAGLEDFACDCYRAVKREYDRLQE